MKLSWVIHSIIPFATALILFVLFSCMLRLHLGQRYLENCWTLGLHCGIFMARILSTTVVLRISILVMFGSICLLFADDAVFLALLEFVLKLFGAEFDALRVNVTSLRFFFKLAAEICFHSPIRAFVRLKKSGTKHPGFGAQSCSHVSKDTS